jgi:FkbM family methyltransferase
MTLIADTLTSAAIVEHPWDKRALDWPKLTAASTVVDVGGYRGRWALQMAMRYPVRILVYEPQAWAADCCRSVLGTRATVYTYGLGVRDERLPMRAYETDGCSFVDGDGSTAELRDAAQVLPERVDVMLMNIEGYEYTLLPYLIENDRLPDALMVQWHRHGDTSGAHDALIAQIERTHRRLWDYGDVLMAWGRHV